MKRPALILLFLLLYTFLYGQASLSVLSWNIRDLGRTKDAEEIAWIAEMVRDYDLVLLQEVVPDPGGPQAVARLADALNRKGARWSYTVSNPTSGSQFKSERYALLWKPHTIIVKEKPALLTALAPVLEREPLIAGLEWEGKPFVILNYHAPSAKDRPMIELRHLVDLLSGLTGKPVLLAGDFNLPDGHAVFRPLLANGYQPVLKDQPTSLVKSLKAPGQPYLLNAFDNIFYAPAFRLKDSGLINTVLVLGSLERALRLSDHVPVWARFEMRE